MQYPQPFRVLDGDYSAGLLLLADHATNHVPEKFGSLGLGPESFQRHIAYDIGVEPLTEKLSTMLGAPAVLSCFSRLLIDPNRGEDDPTLIMKLSDGAVVPGNHPMTEDERNERIALFHRPYHEAVAHAIRRVSNESGKAPLVISLHSFTPFWKTVPRPWQAGVLWDNDPRAVTPMIEGLRALGYETGDNEPYDGALKGDTMYTHCMRNGIPHALLEVRQDLIGTEECVDEWANALAPLLATMNADPALHEIKIHTSRTGPYED
ncbi:N-formylglutamate amidohydrolase [Rhizobium sp. L1K21]|uniref:N-formylglutamate amidohydrolase n=1 Tax=Rhizobium sp. L1K21 TaxID=2954933 RepID=UPI0020935818|nr:N-formylglutamate amidohydrolase [Rhizobium sp. L1K21]MCO6185049.1 N-formylglutamate amidohydrolase [Rhizobium sp. L1K21]